jgi:hypothetical protein
MNALVQPVSFEPVPFVSPSKKRLTHLASSPVLASPSNMTSTSSSCDSSSTKTHSVSDDAPPIPPLAQKGLATTKRKMELLVFRGGKWVPAPPSETLDSVTWNDVRETKMREILHDS